MEAALRGGLSTLTWLKLCRKLCRKGWTVLGILLMAVAQHCPGVRALGMGLTMAPASRPRGPELGRWMPPYTRLLAISMAAALKLVNILGSSTWFGVLSPN